MPGPHRFFYGNSGAEAVECAFKLARYHTKRQHVIAFFGAFHGRTMGALSLTGSKPQQKRRFAPLVPGVTHVRYPYAYRGCTGGAQEQEAFALGCARYIEDMIFKTTVPPEEVAAIFVEPIQGEGGYIVAPDNFMQRTARASATATASSWSSMKSSPAAAAPASGGPSSTPACEPDIVCIAKGIASGMPLGVCMSRAEIMDWVPGSHASTFGGNPVSIAAALATMDIINREAMANAANVGEFMLERLRGWVKTHPLVGDVRGRGLMIGIELVKNKATREPAADLRDRVETLAFERGLMVLGCGQTTLRLSPPLVVSKEEATVALDILEDALTQVEKEHAQAASPATAAV